MFVNILSVLVVLALAIFFGWLLRRAWRSRRAAVKWPASILTGLLTVLLAAVAIVAAIGLVRVYAPQSNPVANVQVAATAEQVARGQHLANICIGCHSSTGNLPLDGSKGNLIEDGPPFGDFYPPNLTPAGPLKDWSDGEIIRSIREGVHKTGRPLLVMPTAAFHTISDADAQALVAYLRQQPAVNRPLPDTQPNILGVLLIGSGMFPSSVQPPIRQPIVAPPRAVSAAYGEYLVGGIGACRDCHGADLGGSAGGGPAGGSPAPNLRSAADRWSADAFVKTFRTGITPDGHTLSADMPWQDYSRAFEDDELQAIHSYLKSMGPLAAR